VRKGTFDEVKSRIVVSWSVSPASEPGDAASEDGVKIRGRGRNPHHHTDLAPLFILKSSISACDFSSGLPLPERHMAWVESDRRRRAAWAKRGQRAQCNRLRASFYLRHQQTRWLNLTARSVMTLTESLFMFLDRALHTVLAVSTGMLSKPATSTAFIMKPAPDARKVWFSDKHLSSGQSMSTAKADDDTASCDLAADVVAPIFLVTSLPRSTRGCFAGADHSKPRPGCIRQGNDPFSAERVLLMSLPLLCALGPFALLCCRRCPQQRYHTGGIGR